MITKSKAIILDKFSLGENWNWFDYKIPNSKTLQIEGTWQNRFGKLIDNSVQKIIIDAPNAAVDLGFVEEFPNLKSIGIASQSIENFDSVKKLNKLEELSVISNKNQIINFDIEANLKILSLVWRSKFEISCLPKRIEYLSIDKGSNINWKKLLENKNSLLKVELLGCDIDSADILFKLKSLRYLSITGCKKIAFDNVANNTSLRFIDIRETPLKTLRWINSLKGIQIICITTAGNLDTVSNINNKDSIIGLLIAGNTTIEDGNLSSLETLRNLRNCFIIGKKHYSHKSIECWNWQNFHLPKKELLAIKK